jgi:hypothetical protein
MQANGTEVTRTGRPSVANVRAKLVQEPVVDSKIITINVAKTSACGF